MFHAVTSPIPLRPALAALSIAERLCEVIRRNRLEGRPTTREDFRQAEETCDLTDEQVDAHIGAAKRLMHPEVVRHDQPASPLMPWDADPSYRAERIAEAAGRIAATLRAAHYTPDEIAALGPAITAAALARLRPANPGSAN